MRSESQCIQCPHRPTLYRGIILTCLCKNMRYFGVMRMNNILRKKNGNIFLFFDQIIGFGYSLEPTNCEGLNEYPKSMFQREIRKTLYTPL